MKKWSRRSLTVIFVLGVLIAARIALPYVALHYANKALTNMDGYRGHIEDIDIALIRGAYKIDSIYLNKLDSVSGKETPFFAASIIDLSVEWKALFHGSIVGELKFENPVVRFTREKVEPKDLQKDSTSLLKLFDDFMPLEVNKVTVNNGNIRYIDGTSTPKVDISLTDLHVVALNLKNSYDSSALLPASVKAQATVYEGTLQMNVKLNPLAQQPTFDMNAELKKTNLVLLNEFFQAYAKIDVNKGTFGLYTEVAAKEGGFTGYVKPLIEGLDILGKEDRKDNIFRKLWEAIAGGAGELFENQPNDQVATKIPFEGKLDDPKANLWITIANTLQNAFVRAIQPSIDNEINLASVDTEKQEDKTILQKVFGKDEDNVSKADKKAQRKKDRATQKEKKQKAGTTGTR